MKPNIIFILSDQQRFDSCGCYDEHAKKLEITPNLDRMAEEGVLFENAFTCQPLCTPARSCIQTGLYATEAGVFRNGVALPTNSNTIAKYLSKEGYKVGYIGKWHLASNILTSKRKYGKRFNNSKKPVPSELRGGYDDFWLASDALEFTSGSYQGRLFDKEGNKVEFSNQYRVDFMTDKVLEYLENQDGENPFFLFISYLEPHHQNKKLIFGHFEGPLGSKEKYRNFRAPKDLIELEGNWKEEFPDYLGCCNSLDENLKRIQNTLKELGLDKNTLIIYTSDHGCHFKTRNSEYKRSCHESSIHIPLVIKGPGFQGGQKIHDLVGLIDLAPTLLKTAGIDIPPEMQGKPLHGLIDGKEKDWVNEIFVQISESQVGRAIRTKKWKYSVRAPHKNGFIRSKSKKYREDFLYDIENDPFEQNNLIELPEYKEIRKELAELLKEKMKEAHEQVPKIVPK
ncbi:MAG: DUF4976 domain-containing protein [Promethearchaeota archaeon]|nr:MAG: DUF4976 domain-containing protein [Candidatus Lokiarchaeota archaeon]